MNRTGHFRFKRVTFRMVYRIYMNVNIEFFPVQMMRCQALYREHLVDRSITEPWKVLV